VRSTLEGDEAAFEDLVSRHKSRIFSLVARFSRDAHQIDDLAQEVFVRAWQRLEQFRKEAPFEHWLVKIAVHTCYDFVRRQQRSRFFQSVPVETIDLPAPDTLSADDARERVEAALARLKPKERLILTLLELEERSIREVAELTGWSESAVKLRAFRARQALKKIFHLK